MCNAPLDWVAEKMRSQGAEIAALRAEVERLREENTLLADELEDPTKACRWHNILTDPPVVHGVYLVMHQDRTVRYMYLVVDHEDPHHYLKQNITHWAEDKP